MRIRLGLLMVLAGAFNTEARAQGPVPIGPSPAPSPSVRVETTQREDPPASPSAGAQASVADLLESLFKLPSAGSPLWPATLSRALSEAQEFAKNPAYGQTSAGRVITTWTTQRARDRLCNEANWTNPENDPPLRPGLALAGRFERLGVAYQYLRLAEGWSAEDLADHCSRQMPTFGLKLRELKALKTPGRPRRVELANKYLDELGPVLTSPLKLPRRPLPESRSPVPSSSQKATAPVAAPKPPPLQGILRNSRNALFWLVALGGVGLWWKSRRGLASGGNLVIAVDHLDRGQAATALPLIQGVLAGPHPRNADAQAQLVRCLLHLDQTPLALEAYREVETARCDRAVLYQLGRDLEARGQAQQATEVYARLYLSDAAYKDVAQRYQSLKQSTGSDLTDSGVTSMANKLPARFQGAQLLGQGGMGMVFRCKDNQTGSTVAVKMLSPLLAQDPVQLKRFAREVKALCLLTHPNVVRILDSLPGPPPLYTMELYEAPNLRQVMAGAALPAGRALAIAAQIARALECAHGMGITHRDIKPENVLVGLEDVVKVVDFGLAFLAGGTVMTQSGQAPGTLRYMSPEQLDGATVGAASDVYALGLVLFEMLEGEPAWGTDDWATRLVRSPRALESHPTLGMALSNLVGRCLALKPEDRPPSAKVAQGLTMLLGRLA